jgi:hypothetical protein
MSTSSSEDNDNFSNFKPKSLTKPKPVTKKIEGNNYEEYLAALNQWLIEQNLTPRFESYADVQTHFSKSKAGDKLVNAYRRLVLKQSGRGNPPDINSWTIAKKIVKPENNNEIFDDNQMNQPVNNKLTFAQAFPAKRKTKIDWESFNNKVNDNYWKNRMFPITGDNVAIRYDSKYMRPDYFNDIMMKDPKKNDPQKPWTRTIEDLDGDQVGDIVIRDGDKKIRYFNGYSLKPEDENRTKQKFMMTDREDGYWGNEAYKLHKDPNWKPRVKSTFETIVDKQAKELDKLLKAYYKNNKRMSLILAHLSLASKLAAIIKTYALTPVALLMTVPNIDMVDVKNELFKPKHSSFFIKLYKKGGEHTEAMRNNMQQLAANPTANNGITAAIDYIYKQFLALAQSKPDQFVTIVDKLSKSDDQVAVEWRNKLFDTTLNVVEEVTSNEISEINDLNRLASLFSDIFFQL